MGRDLKRKANQYASQDETGVAEVGSARSRRLSQEASAYSRAGGFTSLRLNSLS